MGPAQEQKAQSLKVIDLTSVDKVLSEDHDYHADDDEEHAAAVGGVVADSAANVPPDVTAQDPIILEGVGGGGGGGGVGISGVVIYDDNKDGAGNKVHDVTATTYLDVTGLDDREEEEDDDEYEEHEIQFGRTGRDTGDSGIDEFSPAEVDGAADEPDLDELLAPTSVDDDDDDDVVDSAAAEHDENNDGVGGVEKGLRGGGGGGHPYRDEMDDLLNELLDDTANAAEELEDLLADASPSSPSPRSGVPHVGDVDEAKAASSSQPPKAPVGVEMQPSVVTDTPTVAPPSKMVGVRHVQPLASLAKGGSSSSVEGDSGPAAAAKVSRPNLSARIPGTRRYVPPSSQKPSLSVVIPPHPEEDAQCLPTKSVSPPRRLPSPKPKSPASQSSKSSSSSRKDRSITVPPSAAPQPSKKKGGSMIKTFVRALSGGGGPKLTTKKVPGELSPRAQSVLPTLKPIDPGSRLLKETSASVAQKRRRFVPPPLTFPTIGEVMRAIHSGAFDRKASSSPPQPSSPNRSSSSLRGGAGSGSQSSPGSHRSRSSKKTAF
jgi:hypothetical protein